MLLVTRLDHLDQSTRDLLNTLAGIADCKAGFRSLSDAWNDTTTPHGRLILTVLGGLVDLERELIRSRMGEGRARAKASRQSLGLPLELTNHQKQEAIARRKGGETTPNGARRIHGVCIRLGRALIPAADNLTHTRA